jgi:hypothetical protein
MKIAINTDSLFVSDKVQTVGPHSYVISELESRGLYTSNYDVADVVWNIDSIHHVGMKKGKKLTLYWEADEFMICGKNKQFYEQADINYINMSEYINFYPPGTKCLRMAVNPEIMKEYPVPKDFDYTFIGSIEPLPVYSQRLYLLDKCLKHSMKIGQKILVSHGLGLEFPKLMSRGKVILDFLPLVPETGNICIHQRLYESMAVGCVMVNYHPFLDRLFKKDVHYVTFDKFGTITDEEIQRVKENARKLIVEKHTWKHRVDQVLNDINEKLS